MSLPVHVNPLLTYLVVPCFLFFDLLVSYLWLTHGLLVTYLWVTCGLLMGYFWHTFGLLGTYLGLLGTYLWSTSVLLGTHLGLPWNLLVEQLCLTIGTRLRLAWDSLLTLLGFFWNLPGTHLWVTCGLVVCFHEAYLCFLWLTCDLENKSILQILGPNSALVTSRPFV